MSDVEQKAAPAKQDPQCSDPRRADGCPWEDHEHDPGQFHVVGGEWRRKPEIRPDHLSKRKP